MMMMVITMMMMMLQYECTSPVLAPVGCLQYYNGASGLVQSFNYMQAGTCCQKCGGILISCRYSCQILVKFGFIFCNFWITSSGNY